MNSHDWHRQALTSTPSVLAPITVRRFERLNQQEQNEHWTALNRWMASQPIDCPLARQTTTRMHAEVHRNEFAPRGAKTIIGLSAANGVGKSTLIKHLAHQLYSEAVPATDPAILPTRTVGNGATVDWIPQIYITLRAASRIQEVNTALLSFLGYPTIGQTRATTTRVVEAIRTHGVKLLILDDAHMLKTNQADARDVLDYLKYLNTELGELGGTMILVGANLEDSDVYADAQIATRLAPLQLRPHAIFPVSERARFQAMLRGVEERFMCHLDTATAGTLTNELAGEIWRRTQGYLGDVHRLITTVILEAFDAGEDTITRERLRTVPLSARATAAEASLPEAEPQRSHRSENKRKKKTASTPPTHGEIGPSTQGPMTPAAVGEDEG
ncbi:TniB family NTP-binding protein [Micrococcus luteus]|nr:TniB family NTP-binding protein [Micrococcus luteus]MCV7720796.1 TniB family NTP-binding protein [Micrococcus luteus]MCV7740508.1 TniB family NTP-binding protein [Micrococcus luteus]